jgi:hypothetical protein
VRIANYEHGRLVLILESGLRIGERQLRAVTERAPDGHITQAYTIRDEDLRMPVTALPSTGSSARSSAYGHWKEIATATLGILATEPRYTHIWTMLQRCEDAFKSGNETAFLKAKQQLLNFITASTPRIKSTPASAVSQTAKTA